MKNRILLVGPLPPPFGGARISFKLFYDFITENSNSNILHFDLPYRFCRNHNPPGEVNFFKTLWSVFVCLFRIPLASKVIIFGSKNFCFSYGMLFLITSRLFHKPFYFRFFGGHPAKNFMLNIPVVKDILLSLLRLTDQIFVQTQSGANQFPHYLNQKISVIVGYRTSHPKKVDRITTCKSSIKFIYTGGITKEKGVENLLQTFARVCENYKGHKSIELHLYGSGSMEIVKLIHEMEKVFYHGKVDNDTLRAALDQFDVFVFPSQYDNEGHPGSIIEALMAGLPVIASNLPGISEVVECYQNGLLVRPKDNEQLADAMIKIIMDDSLRFKLSEGALNSSVNFKTDTVLPKLAGAMGIELK